MNVYIRFAKLRNTYPSLAEGKMSKHGIYNENNTTAGKTIAAWYMTKDTEKMLVIHNFGVSATEITLTDKIEKAVGVNGDIQQKKDGDDIMVKWAHIALSYLKYPNKAVFIHTSLSAPDSASSNGNGTSVGCCFVFLQSGERTHGSHVYGREVPHP